VELAEERAGPATAKPAGPAFTFVHIPLDGSKPVKEVSAPGQAAGDPPKDVLIGVLAPAFASSDALDGEVVERESAARLKNMMLGGGDGKGLPAPKAATLQTLAAAGAVEAYPLARGTAADGFKDVKLYIDEIGALRGRGRNARAEALAAAAGLSGLSIHGDAFVGRTIKGRNSSFALGEMAPESAWCAAARSAHAQQALAAGHGDADHLAKGDDASKGYTWSQTDTEVEVRVLGVAPLGKGASKAVHVSYGKGDRLVVKVNGGSGGGGAPAGGAVELGPLFARVDTEGCAWTLDGADVVVSMEKAEARAWTYITLSGSN